MSQQTRIAYLNEYRAARAKGDYDRAISIVFDAMEHDEANPDEPLMPEIRGLHQPAAA
ncbi:hypothetical protein [Streptomyces wuyuanensis]|uniref:Uncharacterized protein n=1 Tax=Streptomyces wuyuanensis TaxID=1196353 RepID=A0A1G9ZAY8_9ACTN|nr:hypothetical protein [Streptomyces wuyuanensis]SDN18275.1 hypothetical protein SAMN05444921_12148 [Streptomyces wuyuanensis]